MNYQIRYTRQALADARTLPALLRKQAKELIEGLAGNPYPTKSKELRGLPACRRIWLGRMWRILYQVDNETKTISVLGFRRKDSKTYQDVELAFTPEEN